MPLLPRLRRVVHFVPYFSPHKGGLEMYAKEWAEHYTRIGGDLLIVTFSPGQIGTSRKEEGYEVIVLPAFDLVHNFPVPKFWSKLYKNEFAKILDFHPEIIHTHTRFFLSTFIGGKFAKKNNIPWFHIEHGSGFVVSKKWIISLGSRLYDRTIGKWSLTHANMVIAVSKACENFVRNTFSVTKVVTVYRGIDIQFGNPNRPNDRITIGFIGRLVDLKGVSFLISAFAAIHEEYRGKKRLELKIVGDGPEKEKLKKIVEYHGISDSVEFLGENTNEFVRFQFLPSVHIFVNPSLQEGLPTTVMEALVSGARVVATDVGGTRELLRFDDFTLVRPGDAYALKRAILDIFDTIEIEREPVKTMLFSWKHMFLELEKLYEGEGL